MGLQKVVFYLLYSNICIKQMPLAQAMPEGVYALLNSTTLIHPISHQISAIEGYE